jgi:hypothetical protein
MAHYCYVSNISPQLTEHHLRELFECCGAIKKMELTVGEPRTCTIQFGEEAHAKAAFFLSGTPLGDRPLTVALQTPMSYDGAGANRSSNQVARTIYVGNLNLAIDEDALRQFFSSAGTVTATKLAGEADGKQTRFAFVEFDTPEQAQMALTLQGTVLADKAIKVGKAVNPIQKSDEPSKNINEIMRKVLAHTERLSKDIERSRSRSRDRGGRRRRSRSRDSRDRHRDRRRSRSRSPPREIVIPRARKEDKPKVDRTGMFFDGYRWQPIQPVLPGMSQLPAATKLFGIPPGQVNQPPQGR